MSKIRVGIFGFGKTGKLVANEFLNDDLFELSWVMRKSDLDRHKYASRLLGHEFDAGKIVSEEDLDENFAAENPVDVLIDFSTSSSVNLYTRAVAIGTPVVTAISNYEPDADIEIVEEHFKAKSEVSGTAKKIAGVLDLNPETHINSIRVGGIVGRHEIIFGLPNQTIRLSHESISRAAFGQGAIFATKALIGQPPGMYTMETIIAEMFRQNIPVY